MRKFASETACKEVHTNQEGTRFLRKKARKYKHILRYVHYNSILPRLDTLIYDICKHACEMTISNKHNWAITSKSVLKVRSFMIL